MKKDIKLAVKNTGGAREVAKRLRSRGCRVSRQAVYLWMAAGIVPPKRVLALEAVTGTHRHLLNPKMYPEPPPPPPAAEVEAPP